MLHHVNSIVVNSCSYLYVAYGKVSSLNKNELRTISLDALLDYHTLQFLFCMFISEQYIIDQVQMAQLPPGPLPPVIE